MNLNMRTQAVSQGRFNGETAEQKARHRKIALKYSQTRKRGGCGLATLRIRDLRVFLNDKYGATMPQNDPLARDHLIMLLHHVAQLGDPRAVRACAALWAPWLTEAGFAGVMIEVERQQHRWRADSLGQRIGLTDATRTRLSITTIGANDITKAQRLERRNRKSAAAKAERRAVNGAKPRASSTEKAEPWVALGVSRRTFYYRQKKLDAGTVYTGSASLCTGSASCGCTVCTETATAALLKRVWPNQCKASAEGALDDHHAGDGMSEPLLPAAESQSTTLTAAGVDQLRAPDGAKPPNSSSSVAACLEQGTARAADARPPVNGLSPPARVTVCRRQTDREFFEIATRRYPQARRGDMAEAFVEFIRCGPARARIASTIGWEIDPIGPTLAEFFRNISCRQT